MNRTNRPRLSRISGSSYASKLLGRAGDGSTLTLDFTTGVLDPRLTFTRSTNATFINSSGLVQYADANYVQNSNDVTASGWTIQNGATRSFDNAVVNPEGGLGASLVTASSSIGSSAVNTSSFTVNGGLTYTVSFWIRAGTATQALVGVYDPSVPPSGAFTPASALVISGPGSASGSSSIVVSGLTSSWTRVRIYLSPAYSGSRAVSIYPDAALASGKSIYIWGVKWEAGHVANPTQITTGATAYYAPRFDYDPTSIGTPRGLLIEGSANNLCLRSEDFADAVWKPDNSGATNPDVYTVSQTAPNGASSVNRITLNKTGGTFSRLYQAITGTAGQTYTLSVWMKANTANGGAATQNVGLRIGGSTGINCVVTTTWQRFTHPAFAITGTDANFQLLLWDNIPANDETADVLVWGAQVELGSGASSYLPTGASTGNRAQDLVSITLTNFSSWWTSNNPASFLVDFSSCTRGSQDKVLRIADSTGSAYGYEVYFYTVTMPVQVRAKMSSPSQSDIAIGSNLPANTRTKVGFTIETAALKRFRDGSLANTLTTPTLPPSTLTQMYIGGNSVFGNSSADFHIRQFKYWPITLSDAAMQGFTT